MSFPLLSSLLVRDAMQPCDTLPGNVPIVEAVRHFDRDPDSGLALLDESGNFAGVVTSQRLYEMSPELKVNTPLIKLVPKDPLVLNPEDHVDAALEQLTARGISWAPVVESGRLLGRLTVKDAIATYRNTLERSIRRTSELPGTSALFEVKISPSSLLAGKTLRDAHFPPDTLVVSITRKGGTIFPHADTRLEPDDVVTVMADPASEPELHAFLGNSKAALNGN
jgi:CBS domain-containing protein